MVLTDIIKPTHNVLISLDMTMKMDKPSKIIYVSYFIDFVNGAKMGISFSLTMTCLISNSVSLCGNTLVHSAGTNNVFCWKIGVCRSRWLAKRNNGSNDEARERITHRCHFDWLEQNWSVACRSSPCRHARGQVAFAQGMAVVDWCWVAARQV